MIGDAKVETVSKNLIYVVDEEKNKITNCVLEVYDTDKQTMRYITIPTKGQIVISSGIYKKLYQINQEIPQVFTLSKLCKYFDDGDDTAYGYGVILIEDYFDIDISYYTVVPEATFDQAFEQKEYTVDEEGRLKGVTYATASTSDTDDTDEADGDDPYEHDDRFATNSNYEDMTTEDPAQTASTEYGATTEEPVVTQTKVDVNVLQSSFLEQMVQYADKSSLEDYMTTLFEPIKSNLGISDKLTYVDNYLGLSQDDIEYYCVPGYFDEKTYIFAEDESVALFRSLGVTSTSDAEDSESDEDTDDEAEGLSSELFHIVILNASNTSGVAASWSEKMTSNGYNVKEIGNYDSGVLTDSKIIVAKEGEGEEFLKYFTNATIEVGTLPDGVDAELVIGTNDIDK
jgi:hypothetical protein